MSNVKLCRMFLVAVALAAATRISCGIKVVGNHIVNQQGQVVNLRGLNHAGTEYACVQGWGIFDGVYDQTLVQSFQAWKSNAIRVPLNEDCWLGINGVNSAYSGQNYITAISTFVTMFTNAGFIVILDLHWTAPGTQQATGQQPMPDMDHSVDFWKSVATYFKSNPNVIFELFNEPYPDNNNWNSQAGWQCWRDGGTCSGVSYQVAGMQTLVNAVRGTGATNILLLGGVAYSNSLAQWVQYAPTDPLNNTAAAWHSYNFNYCNTQSCWNQYVAPVASKYPVIVTEFGENDCQGTYVVPLLQWLDSKNCSTYLAWTFNAWDCSSGPALISSYSNNGTPTTYGQSVKTYYGQFAVTYNYASNSTQQPTSSTQKSGIKVIGNHIVNQQGQVVKLRGLSHSGTEYACVQGWGIFDGVYDQTLVQSFQAWKSNAIRVPLNEDCWLGINGVNSAYSGQNYITAISTFVTMFTNAGFIVILDLHWTAPGTQQATGQQPMPDMDHSVDFWKSVATYFKSNPNVIFELFNEPYPDNNNWNSQAGWQCWRDGGTCSGVSYQAAGMQTLVNAVRGTGASNILLLGGVAYSNSLAQWVQYAPTDPLNNTAAVWHSFNFNYCNTQTCWDQYVAPVASKYPVVVTEFGENDCQGTYVVPMLQWLDSKNCSTYVAWTFNVWDCSSGPALISSYSNNGTPTTYGQSVKTYYGQFAVTYNYVQQGVVGAEESGTTAAASIPLHNSVLLLFLIVLYVMF